MLRTMSHNSPDPKPPQQAHTPVLQPNHHTHPSATATLRPPSSFSSVTPPLFHPPNQTQVQTQTPPPPTQHSPSFHTNLESPISKPSHPDHHPAPAQSKWRVTPSQKDALLAAFAEDAYPELAKKTQLAEQLGVTTTQISKWFQHRRESLTRLGQFKAQYNRTRRTPEELDILQTAFALDRYPTADRLAELEAQLTGVTAKQIKLWFKHRRKQSQKRNRPLSPPTSHPPPIPQSDNPQLSTIPVIARPVPEWQQPQPPPQQNLLPLPTLHHAQSTPVMPPTAQPTPPQTYAFPSHSYYPTAYKPPLMLASAQFSEHEYMALRGAFAISNGLPAPDALSRLAHLLNRPPNVLADWFRCQDPARQPPENLMSDVHNSVFAASASYVPSDPPRHPPSSYPPQQPTSANLYSQSAQPPAQMAQSDNGTSVTPPLSSIPGAVGFDAGKAPGSSDIDAKGPDTAAAKHAQEKTEPFAEVVQHVPPGMYQPYVTYPAGMVPGHTGVPFAPTAPGASSAPMLAPLRYVPTTSSVQPYPTGWYGQPTQGGSSKG